MRLWRVSAASGKSGGGDRPGAGEPHLGLCPQDKVHGGCHTGRWPREHRTGHSQTPRPDRKARLRPRPVRQPFPYDTSQRGLQGRRCPTGAGGRGGHRQPPQQVVYPARRPTVAQQVVRHLRVVEPPQEVTGLLHGLHRLINLGVHEERVADRDTQHLQPFLQGHLRHLLELSRYRTQAPPRADTADTSPGSPEPPTPGLGRATPAWPPPTRPRAQPDGRHPDRSWSRCWGTLAGWPRPPGARRGRRTTVLRGRHAEPLADSR